MTDRSTAAKLSAQDRLNAYLSRKLSADFNEVTFGVEIECLAPRTFLQAYGIRRATHGSGGGIIAHSDFPRGWRAESDGSLSTDNWEFEPTEFISPPLKGLAGFQDLQKVLEMLQTAGAKVNSTCGFHVHVGLVSLMGERANDLDLVANLTCRIMGLVSRHELALVAISGKRSRIGNTYCRSIKPVWKQMRREDKWVKLRSLAQEAGRYQTVNIQNIIGQSNANRRTVEFRVFGATVNPLKAVGLVATVMGLCIRAANSPLVKTPNWEALSLDGQTEDTIVAQVAALQKEVWSSIGKEWKRHYGSEVKRNQVWNAKRLLRSND